VDDLVEVVRLLASPDREAGCGLKQPHQAEQERAALASPDREAGRGLKLLKGKTMSDISQGIARP